MKRVLKALRELAFNSAELVVIYCATFLSLPWAMNITKFWIILYFGLALFVFAVSIAVSMGIEKITTSNKPLEKIADIKEPAIPRWIHRIFDVANVAMLIANGWWFFGSMHLVSVVLLMAGIGLLKQVKSKIDKEIQKLEPKPSEIFIEKAATRLRFLRPETEEKRPWYKF